MKKILLLSLTLCTLLQTKANTNDVVKFNPPPYAGANNQSPLRYLQTHAVVIPDPLDDFKQAFIEGANNNEKAEAMWAMGVEQERRKMYKEAYCSFTVVIELQPHRASAYLERGRIAAEVMHGMHGW